MIDLNHLEGTLAVVTSEARLVVDLVISSKLFHPVDFLVTYFALLGSACKCCHLKMMSSRCHSVEWTE